MKTMTLIAAVLLVGCSTGAPQAAPPLAPLDTAALTRHRLAIHSLPDMRLLATPEGRDVLSNAVSCALPAGASLTAITSDGIPYSFAGGGGLAPAWAQRTPTAGERRRIIACVHARATGAILVGALPHEETDDGEHPQRNNLVVGLGS